MPPVVVGIGSAVIGAAVALLVDTRGRRERRAQAAAAAADARFGRVWEAIGGLREDHEDYNENLAEIRGLLTGLYAELLGDAGLIEKYRPRSFRRQSPKHRKDDVT